MQMRLPILALLVSAAPLAAEPLLPPAGGAYDSQLSGAYAPPPGTRIVSRDRKDPPATGLYNICYVNAFQTQPDETAWWLATHPGLILRRDGLPVEDRNWPGELLLDTGSASKRKALLVVMTPWLQGCAAAGYDAIEADNLDSFSRSGGLLTAADNLDFARMLNERAAALGLASGQKNAVELGRAGRAAGFGFAIAESCEVFGECDSYAEVYGPRVLEIEYTDTPRAAFERACRERGRTGSVVLRDRELAPAGAPGHHHETCR
ncbi:endo alpha-1,4 polygalactosaminidase [Paracoccus sp. MC1862]|nr:endo alpha-1,4 polygalactosaminidase [Paracoccus sp. MC1862]